MIGTEQREKRCRAVGLLRKIGFLAMVLLVPAPVQAQHGYFRAYGGGDGLSQLTGQAFFQDHDGYLWVGTRAGLNRFDGDRFEVFSIQQGLANDWINAITQDAGGVLWVGTNNGVSSWTPEAGFVNYTMADGVPDKQALILTADPDGSVWIGTAAGLARWDGVRFISYNESDGLPARLITALVIGPDERLWVGTADGLYVRHPDGFRPAPFAAVQDRPIIEVDFGKDGTLWVALRNEVLAFREQQQTAHLTTGNGLDGVSVLHLYAARDGTLWLRTSQGLASYDGHTLRHFTMEQGLPFFTVITLYEDREGLLWVGGIGGIAKFVGRPFTNYDRDDGLGSNIIWRIQRDDEGRLWVATTGGLSRRDATGWRTYTTRDGLAHDYVRDVLIDRQGRLWAATEGGLNRFDGRRFEAVRVSEHPGAVVALAEDRDGVLWVAQSNGGLFKGKDGAFEAVVVPGQRFSNARLLLDRQGVLWASGDFGLSRWDGVAWHTYTVHDGLAANEPYYLAEDQQGNLWFGYHSSRGITRFNGTTFTTLTTEEGLSNNAVYSVGVDRDNNVWIGTARGLDCYNGTRFVSYGTADGYVGSESNAGAFLADTDGTLWFGAIGGLSHYNPQYDFSGGSPPPVRIDALRLGETPVAPGEISSVAYRRNDLWAHVAVLSYVNEKQIDLRYRLRGYAEDWHRLGGREVTFTNLSPGTYTLEVQGRKYGGAWSPPAKATFTIVPPFWQTWWFGLLLTGALLGLGSLAFRARVGRITQRNLWLEETVHRLQEVDRLKSEFLANMSHEIRTPLTGILGFSAVLAEELEGAQQEFAHHITRNAERLQRTLGSVLDLALLKNKEMPVGLESLDISAEVKEAVALMRPMAEEKNLILQTRILTREACAFADRAVLNRILDILLDNAIKFTAQGGVTVEVGSTEVQVCVRVRDSGIGIPKTFLPDLFEEFKQASSGPARTHEGNGLGLAIAQRLTTLLGGAITVESQVGVGSTFSLLLLRHQPGPFLPAPPFSQPGATDPAGVPRPARRLISHLVGGPGSRRRLSRRRRAGEGRAGGLA